MRVRVFRSRPPAVGRQPQVASEYKTVFVFLQYTALRSTLTVCVLAVYCTAIDSYCIRWTTNATVNLSNSFPNVVACEEHTF
jgi:hypothetical protein